MDSREMDPNVETLTNVYKGRTVDAVKSVSTHQARSHATVEKDTCSRLTSEIVMTLMNAFLSATVCTSVKIQTVDIDVAVMISSKWTLQIPKIVFPILHVRKMNITVSTSVTLVQTKFNNVLVDEAIFLETMGIVAKILMNVHQMRIDAAINATTRKEATHVPVWTALDWTLIMSLA